LVYTMASCGGKWCKVGHCSAHTLNFYAKMGHKEQMF
jgi:hypothetical protein